MSVPLILFIVIPTRFLATNWSGISSQVCTFLHQRKCHLHIVIDLVPCTTQGRQICPHFGPSCCTIVVGVCMIYYITTQYFKYTSHSEMIHHYLGILYANLTIYQHFSKTFDLILGRLFKKGTEFCHI